MLKNLARNETELKVAGINAGVDINGTCKSKKYGIRQFMLGKHFAKIIEYIAKTVDDAEANGLTVGRIETSLRFRPEFAPFFSLSDKCAPSRSEIYLAYPFSAHNERRTEFQLQIRELLT